MLDHDAQVIWEEIEIMEDEFDTVSDCNNACFRELRRRLNTYPEPTGCPECDKDMAVENPETWGELAFWDTE